MPSFVNPENILPLDKNSRIVDIKIRGAITIARVLNVYARFSLSTSEQFLSVLQKTNNESIAPEENILYVMISFF